MDGRTTDTPTNRDASHLKIVLFVFCQTQKLPPKPSNPKLGVFWKTQEICSHLLQTKTKRTTPCKGVCLSLKLHTDSNYQDICNDQSRLHYCITLKGWAEHSPEMGHWSGARNWWSKAFYPRLSDQSHSGLVWWGDRIQLRPQQYWSLQVINIIIRAVSIVPCCQDEPRGGSLHPAGLGCHWGARLRLGRSRGQLVRVLFLWYFEFPTPCLGKQKPSGGSSDHTHDNCCLQLCSSWQFGKNADIWKWKWTKRTSLWVNVRERCCLLRLSPGIHLWWWTVCQHQHDTDNTRARFEILSELHILVIQ